MSKPDDARDALERLRAAGFDLDAFTDEQLGLIASLSGGEVDVLLDIKERIGDVRPEVEAHGGLEMEMPMSIGGLLF
jgi:hypothetical protein